MSDRLNDTEMAYHRKLVEQAHAVTAARVQHEAALRSWGDHLRAVYELDSAAHIDEEGRIIRQTP